MLALWGDEVVIVTPDARMSSPLSERTAPLMTTSTGLRWRPSIPIPHRRKEGGCADCHASTRTVGLGEGTLAVKDGEVRFVVNDKGVETASGRTVGFDAFVSLDGTPLQHGSRLI